MRVAAKPPYYLHEPTSFVCWNRPWIRARKRFVRVGSCRSAGSTESTSDDYFYKDLATGQTQWDAPATRCVGAGSSAARTIPWTRPSTTSGRVGGVWVPPWAWAMVGGDCLKGEGAGRRWRAGRAGRAGAAAAAAAAANGSIGFQKRAGVGLSAASCRRVLLPRITDWIFAAAPPGGRSGPGRPAPQARRPLRPDAHVGIRCADRRPRARRARARRWRRPAAAAFGEIFGARRSRRRSRPLSAPRMTFAAGPRAA